MSLAWGARLAPLLALLGCASPMPPTTPPAIELSELPGWSMVAVEQASPALISGCRFLLSLPVEQSLAHADFGMTAGDWVAPCADLMGRLPDGPGAVADSLRSGFLAFSPDGLGNPALVTGYFEPEVAGSRVHDQTYKWPIYALPDDPVAYDRAQISAGALAGQGLELFYLKDPVDGFFLQVQGSGRVRLVDGSVVRVGYAGNNGRQYVAIGKLLTQAGRIPADKVSLQSIRAYLAAHPEETRQWLDQNPRFVFFREYAGPGPIGAMGTALTPMVSVAVDPDHVAMGQPIWLNTTWPSDGGGHAAGDPLQLLAIAEDKGGAIKGPGRIDLFWGAGPLAEEMAGEMREQGTYYPIVPRGWLVRKGWAANP